MLKGIVQGCAKVRKNNATKAVSEKKKYVKTLVVLKNDLWSHLDNVTGVTVMPRA